MKREIFGTFALWAWISFFLALEKIGPSPWGFILGLLSVCALGCALELVTVKRGSNAGLFANESPWTVYSMLIWIAFG